MTRRVIRVDIAMSALSSAILNTGHFPRRTESRLPGAALRPICKQQTQLPQLLRPGFGRSRELSGLLHPARTVRGRGCNDTRKGQMLR